MVVGGAAVGAVGGCAAVWHVQILVIVLGKGQRGEDVHGWLNLNAAECMLPCCMATFAAAEAAAASCSTCPLFRTRNMGKHCARVGAVDQGPQPQIG